MVVCKFFQAGFCRYGKNCRFDHIYGSKYSYHANPQAPPAQPAPAPVQSAAGVTDEQLVKQVQSDVQAALGGGQWILSCYSPFKEKPIFPGIPDLSPEEARLFIYEAKNTNNLEQAVIYINNLFKESRLKYEQLLQPNVNIIKVLRSLYKGEIVSSPFSSEAQSGYNSNNAAASIFRSAVQTAPVNAAQSIFKPGHSIFHPPHTETQHFGLANDPAKQLFAQANDPAKQLFAQANDPAKQLFAQANDPAKQLFAQANDPAKQLFAQANDPAKQLFAQTNEQSIFAQNQNTDAKSIFASANNNFNQTNPTDIFATANQNIFARDPNQSQNQSPFSQGNVFQPAQNPSSIFGQANAKAQTVDDPSIYSKMEELNDLDLESFKCDSFQLGYIPELPPPHELCAQSRTQLFN
ncbi:hypothetical protein PYW07_004875 [Mythimna separata]|uniref:Nucleoporin NUP42 n=1 Tax=Mythimna separata TaxID=271217 RepID=A0AAD7YDS6_MYTSE|nr:hypothetical protein PYW07_004875 [Mythimna separata]